MKGEDQPKSVSADGFGVDGIIRVHRCTLVRASGTRWGRSGRSCAPAWRGRDQGAAAQLLRPSWAVLVVLKQEGHRPGVELRPVCCHPRGCCPGRGAAQQWHRHRSPWEGAPWAWMGWEGMAWPGPLLGRSLCPAWRGIGAGTGRRTDPPAWMGRESTRPGVLPLSGPLSWAWSRSA